MVTGALYIDKTDLAGNLPFGATKKEDLHACFSSTLRTKLAALIVLSTVLLGTAYADDHKSVTVLNNTSTTISYVYITRVGITSWGTNQLIGDSATIAPGSERTWDIPWAGCHIDIKAVTSDNRSAFNLELPVCGGTTWASLIST